MVPDAVIQDLREKREIKHIIVLLSFVPSFSTPCIGNGKLSSIYRAPTSLSTLRQVKATFIPNVEQSQPKFTAHSLRAAHLEAGSGNSKASELEVQLQETLELLCPAVLLSRCCNHHPVSIHLFLQFLITPQFQKSLQDLINDIL